MVLDTNNGHKSNLKKPEYNTSRKFRNNRFYKKSPPLIGEMKIRKIKEHLFQSVLLGCNCWPSNTTIIVVLINFFFNIPYFLESLITLNSIFIGLHLNFIKYVFLSKGFFAALRSIFYSYLHRIIVVNCAFSGLIDFYIFRRRY